jgi:hypothetical protein
MTTTTTTPLQRELAFRDADLDANRAGRISEVQDYELRAKRRRAITLGVLAVLVAAFVASAFIFAGWRGDNAILTLVGIGVTLCSAALTGVFARYWLRLSADIRGGEVMVVQGELERVVRPVTRRVVNTMIRVGEVEVFVSQEAFEAFEHRQPYALYRLPYTGQLLSAEKLS